MTYYDHATALALKLDRWGGGPKLRSFEREMLVVEQNNSVRRESRVLSIKRVLATVRYSRGAQRSDQSR